MNKVTIIIPAYKAEKTLKKTTHKIKKYLTTNKHDYEIIIASDGTTDKTHKIAQELSKNKRITEIHNPNKGGRGKALKQSIKKAKNNTVIYMDVDLATKIDHTNQLIKAIEEGNDIATGSRLMKQSKVKNRSLKREITSRGYNTLVKLILKSTINDHQCGFKAINKKTTTKLLKQVKDDQWFFDTELLIKAQKKGLKIKEIPVNWTDNQDKTTVKLGQDIKTMGLKILKLKKELK